METSQITDEFFIHILIKKEIEKFNTLMKNEDYSKFIYSFKGKSKFFLLFEIWKLRYIVQGKYGFINIDLNKFDNKIEYKKWINAVILWSYNFGEWGINPIVCYQKLCSFWNKYLSFSDLIIFHVTFINVYCDFDYYNRRDYYSFLDKILLINNHTIQLLKSKKDKTLTKRANKIIFNAHKDLSNLDNEMYKESNFNFIRDLYFLGYLSIYKNIHKMEIAHREFELIYLSCLNDFGDIKKYRSKLLQINLYPYHGYHNDYYDKYKALYNKIKIFYIILNYYHVEIPNEIFMMIHKTIITIIDRQGL